MLLSVPSRVIRLATAIAVVLTGCAAPADREVAAPTTDPTSLAGPADLVTYVDGHRDDTALVVLRDDDPVPVVSVSPDEPMPLASVRKVLVLLAVADAMTRHAIDPATPVPMRGIERWYAPGTDGGAHDAAVADLGTDWTVDTTVRAMIAHSDNAAADWLLDAVGGPTAVDAVIAAYAMPRQDPAWPLLGEYRAWQRDPAAWLAADPGGRRDLAMRFANGTPAGPVSLTVPAVDAQRRLSLATNRGTAAAWAGLLHAVITRAAAGDAAASYALGVLSWPLANPDNAAAFTIFATKGGSLPGVVTEASVIKAVDGEMLTVIQFYRNVPSALEANMKASFVHQQLLARLALEPAFLDQVSATLGS